MRKLPKFLMGSCISALSLISVQSMAQEADSHPDFSGLYMPGNFFKMVMFPQAAPYTPQAQALVDDFNSTYDAIEDQPGSFCVGPGMPISMAMPAPFPLEIIQRPEDITMFFEGYFQYRKIYMEGYDRPEPILNSRMGYSVGHWEGNDLVVETTYLSELTQGSFIGSGDGVITERFQLEYAEDGSISGFTDELVLSDPATYTEDIVTRGSWSFSPDTPIMEYVCSENIYQEHLDRVKSGE